MHLHPLLPGFDKPTPPFPLGLHYINIHTQTHIKHSSVPGLIPKDSYYQNKLINLQIYKPLSTGTLHIKVHTLVLTTTRYY
jgi:hypothetical protein